MTVHEIDEQISALRRQRDKLERAEITDFKERAKTNVGRCFKVGGQYVKVVGVPIEKETMTGPIFNRFQYPALYLGREYPGLIPFYEDTLFSAAWGDGNDLLGTQYEEITPQEFNEEFERKYGQWEKQYASGVTVKSGFVSSCCDMWNERETDYCPYCGVPMVKG